MTSMSTAPAEVERPEVETTPDRPWVTIVWDDPVNLMDYVTHVFQKLFGYPKAKAERLMLQVHQEGRAAVAAGNQGANGERRPASARPRSLGHPAKGRLSGGSRWLRSAVVLAGRASNCATTRC